MRSPKVWLKAALIFSQVICPFYCDSSRFFKYKFLDYFGVSFRGYACRHFVSVLFGVSRRPVKGASDRF
jgi:hypothetical protein